MTLQTLKIVTGGVMDYVIIGALVAAVVLFFALFVPWLRDFRRELRYINMEIERNEGRERERWIRRKRRLKLSIIPFIRY